MHCWPLLAVLFLCPVANPILLAPRLPENILKLIRDQPLDRAAEQCDDVALNYCQYALCDFTGLNTSLTWRTGTEFSNQVSQLLATNPRELLLVCRARTLFYQCLGSMYSQCINRYYLLDKPNADIRNVFDYIHTLISLDFICNAGFEEVINQWSCIKGATTLNTYQACVNQFITDVTANPNEMCNLLDTFMNCVKVVLDDTCDSKAAGWFACEDIRVGYASDCRTLRCYV